MMRRFICGLLTILLLPAVTPRPLSAQTKNCGWILPGYGRGGDDVLLQVVLLERDLLIPMVTR
jgi:hypothetical protein